MKGTICVSVIAIIIFNISHLHAAGLTDARMVKAKKIADEITDLRSARTASLIESEKAVSPDLFKKVCGPVKKRAMAIAKKEGVKIRHAAIKNRNPAHGATEDEIKFHRYFDENRKEEGLWNMITIEGQRYGRYIKPIY